MTTTLLWLRRMMGNGSMFNWLNQVLYADKNKRISDLQAELTNNINLRFQCESSYDKLFETNKKLSEQVNHLQSEIEFLDNEVNELNSKQILEMPRIIGTITINEVNQALVAQGITDINLSDMIYNTTNITQAKKFTQDTKVQVRTWINEDHDCDNFSFALMGYWSEGLKSFAFGIAWSKEHAFNIMFDDSKILWICEPQNNVWTRYSEIKSQAKYKIVSVMM